MSTGGAGALTPTFRGFVQNSMDGLVLFEACLSNKLPSVPRRPHERERNSLIKSGNIFVYEENACGIKRWTDGVAWSPSRILGNFLVYRELDKPFPPGEKKRAIKRKCNNLPIEDLPHHNLESHDKDVLGFPVTSSKPPVNTEVKFGFASPEQDKEFERSLVGSLIDSYGFRADGLVKKTMSVSINGVSYHMVSYYKVSDVKENVLARPLQDPRLQQISIRPELYLKQNFRTPIEGTHRYSIDGGMHAYHQTLHSPMSVGRQSQLMDARTTIATGAGPAALYSTIPRTHWDEPRAPTYAGYPAYTATSYGSYYKPSSQSSAGVKPANPQDSSQSVGYNDSYPTSYPGTHHDGTHSSAGMISYAKLPHAVVPGSSNSGFMSTPTICESYNGDVASSITKGQNPQMYSAPYEG